MRQHVLSLLQAGQLLAAREIVARALAVSNPDPEWLKLGINTALLQADLRQAWHWFQQLQEALPELDPALARVGSKLANRRGAQFEQQELGLLALTAYRDALRLWPDNPDAEANQQRLAIQLADAEHLPEAALDDSPVTATIRRIQAIARGRPLPEPAALPQSVSEWQQHAELSSADGAFPTAADLRAQLAANLSLPMVYQSQADLLAWRQRFQSGLQHLDAITRDPKPSRDGLKHLAWSNFYLAYQGEDDRSLQMQYGQWLCAQAAALRPDLLRARTKTKNGKPRVGLISGHWYQSTVGSYFASWIEALIDPDWQLDVLALAPNIDDFTSAIVPAGATLQRLSADPDRVAEWLYAAHYDLLIYPELGIDTRLLPLAALPLADQQWAAWGHPVTPGLPTISRYISVKAMEPEGAALHYAESLHGLSGIGTRYRAPSPVPRLSRSDLGLPEGKLLVCPQSPFKIHPDQDRLFAETLQAIPDSHLLLFASERPLALAKLRRRLTQEFAACNIDPKRLIVHPMVSRPRFLSLMASADLMLDTCHWSGGNTALDALFVGLPMVALPGRFMRGRQSAAMLKLASLNVAIAADAKHYATLASTMIDADRSAWAKAFAAIQDDHGALAELRELVQAGLV